MKKACESHRAGREKQQAPGHLSKGKTRTTAKMTLLLSISQGNGHRSRLTGTGTTWGTSPFCLQDPAGVSASSLQAEPEPSSSEKMHFKGISLVLTWCSAGQQKSSQLCPHFPEEAVLGFPWHLSSLCRVTWLWRCPFFRTDEVNGRSAETSFWKSQWMQGRRGNFPHLIFHLNLPFWNLGWLHLCSNL